MKISLTQNNPELMGLFGFSWPEKVAAFMVKRLKGTPYEKKLKTFWGASGKNTELVENLETQYLLLMATGHNPATFSLPPDIDGNGGALSADSQLLAQLINSGTNVDIPIINEFLRAIFVLSRDGKIPYEKWNPQGYQIARQKTSTAFESEQGILDKLKPAGNTLNTVLLIAGVGVGAYLLNQLKGFVK